MHPAWKPYCFFYYPYDLLLTGASGCEEWRCSTEKYVTHKASTQLKCSKHSPSAARSGATSGLGLLGHCSAQVGDGFGFQRERERDSKCTSEDERTARGRERGGRRCRPRLWPLPGGLWVVVLVYCLSAVIFIKLWGQMQSDAVPLLWKGGLPGEHAGEREPCMCLWNEPFAALRDPSLSVSLTLTVMKTRAAAAGEREPPG